ncbi:MAG TPA: YbaB/EbfC family nucleoid-associated protein [bacterium]|jgi:DNA-binding YbaB/EbfC family protein|nr:YbaB/EbfC family nucleoid-associated protein [bacterium]
MPNMFDMLRQAQGLKEKMNQFQKELEAQSFTGTAGGGAVSVTMNGKHQVQKVVIDPKTAASGDVEMLQNLVQTAINEAGQQVNARLKEEVSKMTGGLGLPGMF